MLFLPGNSIPGKKIKAFTILELIIAVTLSAVAVSLAYLVFLNMTTSVSKHKTNIIVYNDMFFFYHQIYSEFNSSQTATFQDKTLKLKYYNNHIIKYTFTKEKMIKKTGNDNQSFIFSSTNPVIGYISKSNQIVQRIKFTLMKDSTVLDIELFKDYAPDVHMRK